MPYTRHFTVRDGLPSNYVYSAAQDYRGFIWFSTDNGIARFDGDRFVVFNQSDGLPDNDVPLVFEDSERRLWVLCWKQAPCYFYNDVLYTTENDTFLKRHFGSKPYYFDVNYRQKRIFFYYQQGEDIKWVEYNRISMIQIPSPDVVIRGNTMQFFSDRKRNFALTSSGVYDFSGKRLLRKQKWLENCIAEEYVSGDTFYHLFADFREQKMYVAQLENDSFRVIKTRSIADYNIVYFGRNYLPFYAGSRFGKVYKSESLKGDIKPLPLSLPQVKWSNVYQDNQKNLWVSTADNGVYLYSPNAARVQENSGDLSANCLGMFKNSVIAGTLKGNLLWLSGSAFSKPFPVVTNGPTSTRVMGIQTINNKVYVAGDFVMGVFNPENRDYRVINEKHRIFSSTKDLEISRSGNLLAAGAHGAAEYDPLNNKVIKVFSEERVVAICEVSAGRYWLGALNGILQSDGVKKGAKWISGTALDVSRITDIKADKLNRIWVGTAQNGLFLCSSSGIVQITDSEKVKADLRLTSYFVKNIHIDERGVVWVSTDRGLNRITTDGNNGVHVEKITRAMGFPDDNISGCVVRGDTVYMATLSGLTWFTYSRNMISEKPGLEITELEINFQKYEVNKNAISLKHDQNNISIGYSAIAFRTAANVVYYYRLLPSDTIWHQTTDKRLNFPQLPDGRFEFQVRAVNMLSNESSPVRSLVLIIEQPWYRNRWFYLLSGLVLIAFITLLLRSRLKRLQSRSIEKAEREKKLADMEMQALRAQMNPHFIFNALTAIQNYFFTHREEEANDYMARFARLIRQMLEYSRNNFISMEDELELLRNYMDLELMRFEGRLEFQLIVDREINPALYRLPSMALQPLLENAINHGIRPRKSGGMIKLEFFIDKANLICLIEDNGPGIELQQNQKENALHKSRGMELLSSRLTALNMSLDSDIKMTIENVHPEAQAERGTRIKLFFPMSLVYNKMKINE